MLPSLFASHPTPSRTVDLCARLRVRLRVISISSVCPPFVPQAGGRWWSASAPVRTSGVEFPRKLNCCALEEVPLMGNRSGISATTVRWPPGAPSWSLPLLPQQSDGWPRTQKALVSVWAPLEDPVSRRQTLPLLQAPPWGARGRGCRGGGSLGLEPDHSDPGGAGSSQRLFWAGSWPP